MFYTFRSAAMRLCCAVIAVSALSACAAQPEPEHQPQIGTEPTKGYLNGEPITFTYPRPSKEERETMSQERLWMGCVDVNNERMTCPEVYAHGTAKRRNAHQRMGEEYSASDRGIVTIRTSAVDETLEGATAKALVQAVQEASGVSVNHEAEMEGAEITEEAARLVSNGFVQHFYVIRKVFADGLFVVEILAFVDQRGKNTLRPSGTYNPIDHNGEGVSLAQATMYEAIVESDRLSIERHRNLLRHIAPDPETLLDRGYILPEAAHVEITHIDLEGVRGNVVVEIRLNEDYWSYYVDTLRSIARYVQEPWRNHHLYIRDGLYDDKLAPNGVLNRGIRSRLHQLANTQWVEDNPDSSWRRTRPRQPTELAGRIGSLYMDHAAPGPSGYWNSLEERESRPAHTSRYTTAFRRGVRHMGVIRPWSAPVDRRLEDALAPQVDLKLQINGDVGDPAEFTLYRNLIIHQEPGKRYSPVEMRGVWGRQVMDHWYSEGFLPDDEAIASFNEDYEVGLHLLKVPFAAESIDAARRLLREVEELQVWVTNASMEKPYASIHIHGGAHAPVRPRWPR